MKKILVRRIEVLRKQRHKLELDGNANTVEYINCIVRLGELENLYYELYGVTYSR